MPHSAPYAFAAALAVLAAASGASAQPDVLHALGFARAGLANADADPQTRVQTIETLGRALPSARGAQAEEVRFLRAIAAADLLLLARSDEDWGAWTDIAAAWGCAPEQLAGAVMDDLSRYGRSSRFGPVAQDALTALRGARDGLPPRTSDGHLRAQLVAFRQLASAAEGPGDPVDALAAVGVDPCPGGSACSPPYDRFGPSGRRAIAAAERALEYAARLSAAAEGGDPFAAAAVDRGLVDTRALRALRLAPGDWGPALAAAEVTEGGGPVDVDAVVIVGPHTVRFGWVPEVTFDEAGQPHARNAQGPTLGDPAVSFVIPSDLQSVAVAIDGLAPALRDALAGATSVGFAVAPGVEAHVLSRVLYSAMAARLPVRALVAPSADGTLRGVAMRASDAERAPRTVGLYVRAGGFTVTGRGPLVSIPRVRAPARGWRFDYGTLRETTTARPSAPLVVSYMTAADAATVVRAALTSWRPGVELTLQLRRL